MNLIAKVEELPQVLAADRAIVFLTVDWSGPERKSRECFTFLIKHLGELPSIDLFVVNEDDDEVRRRFPSSVDCTCTPLGAGTMFWMERGNVIASEINPGLASGKQLFERTAQLWAPSVTDRGNK